MSHIFSVDQRRAGLATAVLAVVAALLPSTALATDRHATPSTFASVFAAAQGGDRVLLAAGSYGTWQGGAKTAPGVTITPEPGATASLALNFKNDNSAKPGWLTLDGLTITSANIASPTHDLTVRNSRFTGSLYMYTGGSGENSFCSSCSEMKNANILFDNNTHNNIDPSGLEGRIDFAGSGPDRSSPVGVTIQNSMFDGGLADGIQTGAVGVQILNNTFTNIQDCGCGPHTDSVQIYGGINTVIRGNYFDDVTDTVVGFDGGSGQVITDNVMTHVTGNPWGVTLGGDNGSTIAHNTMKGLQINMTSKSGQTSRNAIIRDNIASSVELNNGVGGNATPSVNDYNLCSGTPCAGSHSLQGSPTFTGGSNPTSYAGFALANGSAGKANASDGLDRGARITGTPPPPADTTAPDTTITSAPANPTTSTSASIGFNSSEAGSTFECKLDAGAYGACTSPKAYSSLSTGSHTFSVRATDPAGNTDGSAATWTWTINATADTTPPDTTITSGPPDPSTSTSASFAFAANEANSSFECKMDSGSFASCSSPKATNAMSMGSHTFSVRAKDAAGNMDPTPATDTWTIQSAPPADRQPVAAYVYSPTAPAAGQAVSFDASSATCDDTPCTYSWADDGPDGPGGTQWALGSGKTFTFTFTGTGTKYVRVTVTDADGDSDSTMKSIVVAASPPADTTAPETTIDSGPTGTTNDSTPTFAFSSSEGASTFQCRVDSGSWAGCSSPWTTSALSDGAHSVGVRATDAAGNVDASPATRSFTVATAVASQNLLGSSAVQSAADAEGAGSAEAFQATATASGSAVSVSIYVDAGNAATTLGAGIYTDVNGHPGTLLSKGTRSAPASAAWNKVTVAATSLTSGTKYWIALMGTGGTLKYRDGAGASSCHSESSSSHSLKTLPTTWQSGASWTSCPLSGYASS